MQVCGAPCNVCADKIFFQDEGTWCARCNTAFHKKCQTGNLCAQCNQPRLDPRVLQVRSKFCPRCMTPNRHALPQCNRCGNVTQWENEQDYLTRKTEIRAAAQKDAQLGQLELALGVLLVVVTVVFLFMPVTGVRLAIRLSAFALACVIDGIRRMASGNSFQRFE